MADTIKTVRGTLTGALATLYTVPAATSAVIKRIDCYNKHADQTIGVYLSLAGVATFPSPGHYVGAKDGCTFEGTEALATGETVQMGSTLNGYINYTMTLVETT